MDYSNQETYNIGKKQKAIMWLILAMIVASFFQYKILVVVIIGIIGIAYIYPLAKAQKSSVPWLWALLQIIPYVGFICLFILNYKATKILESKGVRVGLMGGNNKDLEELRTKEESDQPVTTG